ncbi:hypothetical protein EV359DRAFT_88199 [Lentinula novae-zelandiae]|nr:hypothetical protein EV359DRAFT_88199 [Lentinula novae-zelandiae]
MINEFASFAPAFVLRRAAVSPIIVVISPAIFRKSRVKFQKRNAQETRKRCIFADSQSVLRTHQKAVTSYLRAATIGVTSKTYLDVEMKTTEVGIFDVWVNAQQRDSDWISRSTIPRKVD